jgi:hypothetical protein
MIIGFPAVERRQVRARLRDEGRRGLGGAGGAGAVPVETHWRAATGRARRQQRWCGGGCSSGSDDGGGDWGEDRLDTQETDADDHGQI